MGQSSPPMLARILLHILIRDEQRVILADLTEEYRDFVRPERGTLRADVWFWRQTFSVLRARPGRSAPRRNEGFFDGLRRDVALAVRTLAKAPLYTVSVTAVLAIAIGSNAAIYAVVHAALFADLPYDNGDRLTYVWQRTAEGGPHRMPVEAPDVAAFQESAGEFESFAFVRNPRDDVMRDGDLARHVSVAAVTTNLFSVLGVAPVAGTSFDRLDSAAEGRQFGLLSHSLWTARFDSDPAIVGRTLEVGGAPVEIIGVLPSGFSLPLPPDVGLDRRVDMWIPLPARLADLRRVGRIRDRDSDNSGVVIGLLRPGADLAAAQLEMDRNARRLQQESDLHREAGVTFSVVPIARDATARYRPFLLVMWGAVVLVLVIACVNVVGLVLARGAARSREYAVRIALGAGKGRLARQLLAENGVLGGMAAVAGALIGFGIVRTVGRIFPDFAPAVSPSSLTGTVLISSLAIMMVAGIVFGLVPAIVAARNAAATSLMRFGVGGGTRATKVGRVLAGTEIGVSLVLVVLAGLVWQTARNLGRVNAGFRPASVVVFDATLRNRETLRGPGDRAGAVTLMEDALTGLPGVAGVGVIGRLPLSGKSWTQPYGEPGAPPSEWARTAANFRVITAGYFDAVGTGLVAGRAFDRFDDRQDRRVAIVDQRLASRIAPGGNAVGASIGIPVDGEAVVAEIVGVVENVRMESLRSESRESIYIPYRHEASRDVSFAVRFREDVEPDFDAIRTTLDATVPDVATFDYALMESYVDRSMRAELIAVDLIGAFAILAAALAAYGLFGVVAFSAGRRRGEMALRVAFGATRADVVTAMIRPNLGTIGLGLGGGVITSAVMTRFTGSFLYGVTGLDWRTFGAAVAAMAVTAVAATYLPARGASRVDPVSALRED